MFYYEEKGENPEDMMITPGGHTSGAFLGFTVESYAGYVWKIRDHVIISYLSIRKFPTRRETLDEFMRFLNYLKQHRLTPIVVPKGDAMLLKLAQEAGLKEGEVEIKGEKFRGFMLPKERKSGSILNWFR